MSEAELGESAEVAHEVIHEEAGSGESSRWISWAAISTMVMALFSAVGALLAGITSNEALLTRTAEIIANADQDRREIEVAILRSKQEVLAALGVEDPHNKQALDNATLASELEEKIAEDELEISAAMHAHELFAIGVTLLSIAITLIGMAVVGKRPRIWHAGLLVGVAGALFVGRGIMVMLA